MVQRKASETFDDLGGDASRNMSSGEDESVDRLMNETTSVPNLSPDDERRADDPVSLPHEGSGAYSGPDTPFTPSSSPQLDSQFDVEDEEEEIQSVQSDRADAHFLWLPRPVVLGKNLVDVKPS